VIQAVSARLRERFGSCQEIVIALRHVFSPSGDRLISVSPLARAVRPANLIGIYGGCALEVFAPPSVPSCCP
jgi:hypothetical protein